MRPQLSRWTSSLLAALALAAGVAQPIRAQYGELVNSVRPKLPWENNRVSLKYLSVEPGAALPAAGNEVLVYLTADPEGRMPAEAVWRPADAPTAQNRGRVRLEAIAIELKDAPSRAAGPTPLEAIESQDGEEVSILIDNPRVLVTKHRYLPNVYGRPLHSHPEDVVVVYLRGGHAAPVAGFWSSNDVHRGDVDLVPANALHRLANVGGDPLELLVIVPK